MNSSRLQQYFENIPFENTPSLEASEELLEELEYICYVKVDDFTQFQQAESAIHQEQWSVFLTNRNEVPENRTSENNVRVRSVNDEQFFLTSKLYLPGAKGKWELEREVERDHFEVIKAIATGGMKKDRYIFPVEGTDLRWEVDVHYDNNGERLPWVRLELEVAEKLDVLPELPIVGSERILRQRGQQTDDEQSVVKGLYDQYVLKPTHASTEDDSGDNSDVVQEAPDGDGVVGEKNDETVVSDDEELNGDEGARLSGKPEIVNGDGDDNNESDDEGDDDSKDNDDDDESSDDGEGEASEEEEEEKETS